MTTLTAAKGSDSSKDDQSFYQYLRPSWWNPAVHNCHQRITPGIIWSGFKEHTTAHGLPRLATAKGLVKNTFWAAALSLAFGLLLFNFVKITSTFFAFQTNVRLSLQNENELRFPVVTLCNMNPLRRSALEYLGILGQVSSSKVKERSKRHARQKRETTNTQNTSSTDTQSVCCCTCCRHAFDYDDVITDCLTCGSADLTEAATCASNITSSTPLTTSMDQPPTSRIYQPIPVPGSQYPERILPTEKFQKENKLTEVVSNLPEDEKFRLGYDSYEMILECHYSGTDCNISSFAWFFNPTHGNCYMFNSGWYGNEEVRKASKTGRRYGLHVILNINQAEYTDVIGDTAGVRIVIHPQNRMPFPEDEGITVSPGRATSIGIRQVVVTRESHPYSNCVDPALDHSDINMYEELYPVSYSANACQKTCYQRHLIKECGCADPYLPMNAVALSASDVKACNSSNIIEDDCKYAVSRRFNNNSLPCNCQDSCRDITFTNELSLGEWPSEIQKEALLNKYADKIGSTFNISDENAYKDNLVKLEVYYEEFNFETIDEVPSYKPGRYLSDIGGALGLWVGFSILTIAEFIELAVDMVVYLCRRASDRSTSRMDSSTKPALTSAQQTKGQPKDGVSQKEAME